MARVLTGAVIDNPARIVARFVERSSVLSTRLFGYNIQARSRFSVPSTTVIPTVATQARGLKGLPKFLPSKPEVLEKADEEIQATRNDAGKIFAVVHVAGSQYKITTNDLIVVQTLPPDVGEKIYLNKVLLVGSENFTLVGTPLLGKEVVQVVATVAEQRQMKEITVFKMKKRKNYRRTKYHNQDVTVLRINSIDVHSCMDQPLPLAFDNAENQICAQ